ncbi:hypothetical protein OG548_08240 [Streptomyces sp. NBC_01356]|uniref:hypothetical protein n=1 Tax=Streptomyces sp. NBC_01356 TaxID=2903836 RepID=UPI002E36822B|nr:hypothetical protein [Streptomyces sp. NBC_01356]
MALDPLATVADLVARGVTVEPSEESAVATYFEVASAIVRDAAGSPISSTVSTVTLEGTGFRLHLPGQPVTAVSAVLVDGVAVTDYRLLSGALARSCGFPVGGEVTVTYTHGLPTVPADIVDLVCRMVGQALVKFRESPEAAIASKPVIQERIGDYSVTYAYELTYSDMELPKYLRRRLAARFGNGASLVKSR